MIDMLTTYYALAFGLMKDGIDEGGVHLWVDGFFALWIALMPLAIVAVLLHMGWEWLTTTSPTGKCLCMTAHPDDPTPCPACCTRWERIRFRVEDTFMRVVHGRTCVCGEH